MNSGSGAGARLEKSELEALFSASFRSLKIKGIYPELPRDIWTEEFFRANELLNLYTDFQVSSVLGRLGVETGRPCRIDPSRLEGLGVPAGRRDSALWLFAKASRSAFARWSGGDREEAVSGGGELTLLALPAGFGRRLREAVLREDAALAPCLDLVDLAAAGFQGFLRGEIEGRDILFSPGTQDLWESYFDGKNPFYQPMNYLAAHAAGEAAGGEALRVLEVGAGGGSGTVTLLEELAGNPPVRFVVTDISPSFLRKARARLEETAGREKAGLEFRLLDLNRPRASWRLPDGEFHLVFAVNVLHCVRDLTATLSGLRLLLRAGGHLVLGECLRSARGRPVHPEFIFQLLDEFRDVAVHPVHRPGWGFLDRPGWRGALAEAGFGEPAILPDAGAAASGYEEQSIAAIVARA